MSYFELENLVVDSLVKLLRSHGRLMAQLECAAITPPVYSEINSRALVGVSAHDGRIFYRLESPLEAANFTFTKFARVQERVHAFGRQLGAVQWILEERQQPCRDDADTDSMQSLVGACAALEACYCSLVGHLEGREMACMATPRIGVAGDIHITVGDDGEDSYFLVAGGIQVIFVSLAGIRKRVDHLGKQLEDFLTGMQALGL